MMAKDELKIPSKYYMLLPEALKKENLSELEEQLKNSILWCFYLNDLSEEERKTIMQKVLLSNIRFFPRFDPVQICLFNEKRRERILQRLKEVLKKIKNYGNILDVQHYISQIHGYLAREDNNITKLSHNESVILREVSKNPTISLRQLARKVGLSVSGARKIYLALKSKIRFSCLLNPHALKLRHFILLYQKLTKSKTIPFREKLMTNVWVRTAYDFSSDPETLFTSVYIPNDVKIIKKFLKSVKKAEKYCKVEVYDVKEYRCSFNMSYLKNGVWRFDARNWLLNMEQRSILTEDTYTFSVKYFPVDVKLTKDDLVLIECLLRDSRMEIEKLKIFLPNLSISEISRKKTMFIDKKIVVPYVFLNFLGAQLDNDGLLLLESSKELEFQKQIMSLLPCSFIVDARKVYPNTCNTLFVFFQITPQSFWNFFKICNSKKDELNIKKMFYESRRIGTRSITLLFDRWDEEKQQWKWYDNEVDVFAFENVSFLTD
ncbi:MAG: hypothetical protein B6U95_00145 [Thermofilum sp. ex4484_82]|nr:MAG: hypothetical protein B6U95_00145 [Thermofilum sp. ex4484_82]OYT40140.1 MAG: hypothetical protein B6U96_00145 [Archaeoglobales archaeon ex4484_92]